MSEEQVSLHFKKLGEEMKPGSHILYRQLNNSKDYSKFYAHAFNANAEWGKQLLSKDRSLFYEKINILKRGEL